MTEKYIYRMLMRPPDPGAVPREGLLFVADRIDGLDDRRKQWGYAVYGRELSKEETEHYDMECVTECQE